MVNQLQLHNGTYMILNSMIIPDINVGATVKNTLATWQNLCIMNREYRIVWIRLS